MGREVYLHAWFHIIHIHESDIANEKWEQCATIYTLIWFGTKYQDARHDNIQSYRLQSKPRHESKHTQWNLVQRNKTHHTQWRFNWNILYWPIHSVIIVPILVHSFSISSAKYMSTYTIRYITLMNDKTRCLMAPSHCLKQCWLKINVVSSH